MEEDDRLRHARLVEEARLGDPLAREQLLQLHRAPLRRMIDHRLDPGISRREDASDIVQNVIFEAHKRLSQYLANPTMPFHLWLRHIAQDHIVDAHRRHRQAQRRSLDREQYLTSSPISDQSSIDLAAQLFDHQPTPASEAMRQELKSNLLGFDWEYDIPGYITNADLVHVISNGLKIPKGALLNHSVKMDAENFYVQAGDLRPVENLVSEFES